MTSQQAATHLKLISTLPIRIHIQPSPQSHKRYAPVRFTDAQCKALKKKIRALRKKRKSCTEISRIVECSIQTVYNYLRKR